MNKYTETLNLPKTSFPMRASLVSRETNLLKRWQEKNIYRYIQNHLKKNPRPSMFVLHDGPPYANGKIHIGHSVNKILKDIVVKSRLMNNQHVCYIPGWDCHGLPIEMQVEKKYGKVGKNLSPSGFREHCRQFADQQIDQQRQDFCRLGVIGSWEKPYKTKDFDVEANEILALKKLYEKGYIHHGLKPVYWSTGCNSALAEAEIEYHEKTSTAIDVFYPIKDKNDLFKRFNLKPSSTPLLIGSVIWTTTPWTLPASMAIAVSTETEYALVKINKDGKTFVLFLAKDLVEDCASRYQESFSIMATTEGKRLEGLTCCHPFYDRDIPVILGKHVTTESGTGCVHTAPDHGPDDFEVCKFYDLKPFCPIDENGFFFENIPLVGGMFYAKAEKVILEELRQNQCLFTCEKFQHSYPHCWRTDTPLIFRATNQWFINLQNITKKAVACLEGVRFYPLSAQERMKKMLHTRPDWCISRQRYWGVPIPFITHKKSKKMHPNILAIIDQVAKDVQKKGIDDWFEKPLSALIGKEDAEYYEKSNDVLDVWFDSGMLHHTLKREEEGLTLPADLYLEGSDQHRGWFQSSLLTSVALNGSPPYRSLLTHGFTVDKDGKKMSKSKGNTIAPQKICQTLGADILRLWVASVDYSQEMSVSEEVFKRVSDSYRRIRNTLRYFLGNLSDFDIKKNKVDFSQQLSIDRWAIHQTHHLQKEIITAYDNYEFHTICKKIQFFCAIEMGAFYLDILKDRLYTCQKNSLSRRSAQTTLYHICQAMVRWLSPILFFTSDEVWQHIKHDNDEELLLQTWYEELSSFPQQDPLGVGYWQEMQIIKGCVDKKLECLRSKNKIGGSLDAQVTLYAEPSLLKRLSLVGEELRFIFITSYAIIKPIEEADKIITESLPGLKISAQACPYKRCERSWHRREDVGTHAEYPDLDSRSILNVYGEGEKRQFV